MRSLTLILVLLLLVVTGGCAYHVVGDCLNLCNEIEKYGAEGEGCSADEAAANATKKCPEGSTLKVYDSEIYLDPTNCLSSPATAVEVHAVAMSAKDALRVTANGLFGVSDRAAAEPADDSCSAPVEFTFKFIDHLGDDFCNNPFAPQWDVQYDNAAGGTSHKNGSGDANTSITDAANDMGYAAYVIVRINTDCNADAPMSEWSVLTFGGVIPDGGTVTITRDSDDELTEVITEGATVATAVKQVSGAEPKSGSTPKPDLAPKPDPKFSKRSR